MTAVYDSFLRPINYLRISVTDRCNLRCVYCMPPEGIQLLPQEDILRYEEIAAIVGAAADLGISKIRITGGEPLARSGLVELIRMLAAIPGIDDISLTTNGVLLAQHASALKAAGLHRVNVSLDTLRPERFARIARRPFLDRVMEGIAAAQEVGLTPLKINVVVMRGQNEDEVLDFARLTLEREWHVRFIEVMPFVEVMPSVAGQPSEEGTCTQAVTSHRDGFVSAEEMREAIRALGPLEPASAHPGNGPARYFRLPGARGTIGFISPVSEHFCFQCNRLRLTAHGRLRPCLLADYEIDVREPLRSGAGREELRELIRNAIICKPERHHLGEGGSAGTRPMVQIGG